MITLTNLHHEVGHDPLRRRLGQLNGELKSALEHERTREDERTRLDELLRQVRLHGDRLSILGLSLGYARSTRHQIRELENAIAKLAFHDGSSRISELRWTIARVSTDIVDGEAQLERIEAREAAAELRFTRDRARQARIDANAAMAAQARGTVRTASTKFRKRLKRDHPCPYCFGPLGISPHADHIHPVAKGGLPTLQNIVFVCEQCNQAKKDLTLNQFIDKMGFNRDAILRALKALEKDA